MSAKEAHKRIHAGDHVLAYIPANLVNSFQFLHYEFIVKSIDQESVTLRNFEGDEWTYSLEMLNMIRLSCQTIKEK